jgi:hypothetical protein
MIRTIIGYAVALLLSPTVGALLSILGEPVFIIGKASGSRRMMLLCDLLVSIGAGFLMMWFATLVFRWLNRTASLLLPILLGSSTLANGFRRVRGSSELIRDHELTAMVGNIIGIVVGAAYLM